MPRTTHEPQRGMAARPHKTLIFLAASVALAALALSAGWRAPSRARAELPRAAPPASVAPATSGTSSASSAAPVRAEAIPLQASCGDHRCQPPEDCNSCAQDCGDCCGNRRCEPPEDCNSCAQDCGECCGNRRCEPPEDEDSCPQDC